MAVPRAVHRPAPGTGEGRRTASPSSSATAPTTRSAGASCSPTRRSRTSAPPTRRPIDAITDHFAHWDDIDVVIKGRRITSSGHGFCGIARKHAARAFSQQRARELGVELRFETEVRRRADLDALGLGDADLIVAADGVNSMIRARARGRTSSPSLDVRTGALHLARHDAAPSTRSRSSSSRTSTACSRRTAIASTRSMSTFIVECDERRGAPPGFDTLRRRRDGRRVRALFARAARRTRLLYNGAHRAASPWTQFMRVRNAHWYHENVVLIGDAAHTAHFSVGSGTKLAMEDAIALARELSTCESDLAASARGLRGRADRPRRCGCRTPARNSMEWFEHVDATSHLPPEQFAY